MMNNEDLERNMAFIVNQQAQFAVGMELFREETDRRFGKLENVITEMGNVVTRLAYATTEGFKQLGAKIDTLIDAHIRHEDAFAAHQKRTDERFDAVAAKFDDVTAKFDDVTTKFDAVSARFDAVGERIDALTAKQDRTEELLQRFLRGLTNRRNGT